MVSESLLEEKKEANVEGRLFRWSRNPNRRNREAKNLAEGMVRQEKTLAEVTKRRENLLGDKQEGEERMMAGGADFSVKLNLVLGCYFQNGRTGRGKR